jgi:hypothetical protein
MDIHQFMGMALDFAKAYHRVQKEGAEAVGQWGVARDRCVSTAEGLLAASKAGDPTKAVADRDREWIEAIAIRMGKKPSYRVAPLWMIKMLGWFMPIMKESVEMVYQYDRDYVFDSGNSG